MILQIFYAVPNFAKKQHLQKVSKCVENTYLSCYTVLHRCSFLYHRERILETSTLSCNEEEEEITKPPKR
jgi:hypothetical protein